jgi:(2Fe-2S) ferredoxin
MIVHFAASRYGIAENITHLRHVVDAIHSEGHQLARDWIESSYEVQVKKGDEAVDWKEAYQDSVEAITKADVVIADTTFRSFSVGYQVATAVQMKKPTLVLHQEGSKDSFFASGIEVGVTYKEFNPKNVKEIIERFLKENDIQAKDMRFNFFIDRPIYNYLRWAAYRTGKTKAEILRELVTREIDKAKEVTQI